MALPSQDGKLLNESDMILNLTNRPIMNPFNSHATFKHLCDILGAVKRSLRKRDPRGTAKKAEAYLKKSGLETNLTLDCDQSFHFDDEFGDMVKTSFGIDSSEGRTILGKNTKMVTWVTDLE